MKPLQWVEQEAIEDGLNMVNVYTAVGYEYTYEMHIEHDGLVTVSVWADIAATRWDPPDVACFDEQEFRSETKAKGWADKHNAEAEELSLAYEKEMNERP